MDIQAYLKRIVYEGPLEPGAQTLAALHQAHLRAVPFENLDIPAGRPIQLDPQRLYEKIVLRRRGGFCYELNGLFATLLRELGFEVQLLAAQVADEQGGFGPEFDHMALLVQHGGRWLADVGFGSSFGPPLAIDQPAPQAPGYRLQADGQQQRFETLDEQGHWRTHYRFTLTPRQLGDFAAECRLKQTQDFWTARTICTRATPEGRLTLSDRKLIISSLGAREERQLADDQQYHDSLRDLFGVVLA